MEIKTTIYIEPKTFKNEDGKEVTFNSISMDFKGCKIRLGVKKEDVSLMNYLLDGGK